MTGVASSPTPRNDSALRTAIVHLRNGGLLVYPTETSYAIGCDATNVAAVAAVFHAKGRGAGKSLPIIVASRAMAERYGVFTPLARRLARQHWPGPVALVLRAREAFPSGVIAPNGTIALRISSHVIARALSRLLGRPIVATSANHSGDPACYSAHAAARALSTIPNLLIMDGGSLPHRVPSTIVDVTGVVPFVIRQGSVRL